MLRLELEAQVANAQAEVEAMAADAAIESGTPLKSVEQMVEQADSPTARSGDGRRAAPRPPCPPPSPHGRPSPRAPPTPARGEPPLPRDAEAAATPPA